MKVDYLSKHPSFNSVPAEGSRLNISTSGEETLSGSTGDKVAVTMMSNRFNMAQKYLKALPDVRVTRVAELKGRIDSGAYDINARDVAEKVLLAIKRGAES